MSNRFDYAGGEPKAALRRLVGFLTGFTRSGSSAFLFDKPVITPTIAFAAGDTTPSVSGGDVFKTANSAATVITTLDEGAEGQRVTLLVDANTTIANGATMKLAGGVNFVGTANDTIELIYINAVWYRTGGSVN